ncbi:MAG: DUF4124 domain-containing protein [Gammaproteobacteria bacterium]|nr:DUF4124 domain-containing protein [Gammaproteobacteria bacterium]
MKNVALGLSAFLLAGVLYGPPDAAADIYKCKEADGSLTYSQTPCPDNDTTVIITETGTERIIEKRDCRHAHQFALSTAGSMREGAASTDIFDYYGGVDSLSNGSIGIINYVYIYRNKTSVSIERIASLVESQCEGGTMPQVSCVDLPISFTEQLGGCSDDSNEEDKTQLAVADAPPQAPLAAQSDRSTATEYQPTDSPGQSRADCRQRYQAEIDNIDARMRSGYSSAEGNRLRDKRRQLQTQRSRC